MYILTGVVQHYAWGGQAFLPELLDVPNISHRPYAEYWLGVHPGGPARVALDNGAHTGLPDLIRSDAARYLGNKTIDHFGAWPYLLKVLDVSGMLSIQVHPTLDEARKGFAAENAAGIPLDAPNRNYKDPNHKPEVMVALSEFWLLHGFNPSIRKILGTVQELSPLIPRLDQAGLEGLYRYVMEMEQDDVDAMLKPLAERILPEYRAGRIDKSTPDFWAARVMDESGPELSGLDRGIFSIYFFNVVHLQPGQAIFQGAGVPHAYLEGQNVELMSNSDNVLRAGLTPKHIDIPELMRHTRFESIEPAIMNGNPVGIPHPDSARQITSVLRRYPCPVPDFSIDSLELYDGAECSITAHGPETWLVMAGTVQWTGFRTVETTKGQAVFVLPDEKVTMKASGKVQLYRAFVP
jgi:mannose-6-phosphate isomerase